jgi:hypothetical protein
MDNIIWQPQRGPQLLAVTCSADEIFFGGARGGGKMLANESLIQTLKGWTTHGTVQVGEVISDPVSGGAQEVVGVFPQGEIDLYRVTFADGASVLAGLEHLWAYKLNGHQVPKTLQAKQRPFPTETPGSKYPVNHFDILLVGSTKELIKELHHSPRIPSAEPWSIRYEDMRAVVSIEYEKTDEATCISVSSPHGLYVTDSHIITHNTDTAIGRQIDGALTHAHAWNGLFLRKNFKHFAELRRRVDELIRAGLSATRVGGDSQTNIIKFNNGARITLTAIEREEQLEFFQGQQFTEISVEEATQFPFIINMIDKLKACLRSPHGIQCQLFLTGNPGGPGHTAVKTRYIDPAPAKTIITDEAGATRVFIPSSVSDNKILCRNDPQYVRRLQAISDPLLRKAWLEGNWDVVMGGFYDDVWSRDKHVLPFFRPPDYWPRIMGFDWGSARPFSVGWYTISGGDYVETLRRALPRGAIIRYDEWYGCEKGKPNTGIRRPSVDVAAEILRREELRGEDSALIDRIADPAIFVSQDGPSIAEKMALAGVIFRRGDNKRIPGWEECRSRLAGDDNGPRFYVTENCTYFIQTVPALERDERNWEDVETRSIDHIADEWRYVLMSRQGKGISEAETRPRVKSMFEKDWECLLGENSGAVNLDII